MWRAGSLSAVHEFLSLTERKTCFGIFDLPFLAFLDFLERFDFLFSYPEEADEEEEEEEELSLLDEELLEELLALFLFFSRSLRSSFRGPGGVPLKLCIRSMDIHVRINEFRSGHSVPIRSKAAQVILLTIICVGF